MTIATTIIGTTGTTADHKVDARTTTLPRDECTVKVNIEICGSEETPAFEIPPQSPEAHMYHPHHLAVRGREEDLSGTIHLPQMRKAMEAHQSHRVEDLERQLGPLRLKRY